MSKSCSTCTGQILPFMPAINYVSCGHVYHANCLPNAHCPECTKSIIHNLGIVLQDYTNGSKPTIFCGCNKGPFDAHSNIMIICKNGPEVVPFFTHFDKACFTAGLLSIEKTSSLEFVTFNHGGAFVHITADSIGQGTVPVHPDDTTLGVMLKKFDEHEKYVAKKTSSLCNAQN